MHTVVVREQAAHKGRAILASTLLLGLTIALAAVLISRRTATRLGERMAPAGWPISFRPPAGWTQLRREDHYREFVDLGNRRNPSQFVIGWEPNPSNRPPAERAGQLMAEHLMQVFSLVRPSPAEHAALGPLPGARVSMPDNGAYVHVGWVPGEASRLVVLRYHTQRAFGEHELQLCRQLVESVQAAGFEP